MGHVGEREEAVDAARVGPDVEALKLNVGLGVVRKLPQEDWDWSDKGEGRAYEDG